MKLRARSLSTGNFADIDISMSYNILCSTDGITWAQVPNVHPVIVASASKIRSRFTGDLSHEYVVNETSVVSIPNLPEDVCVSNFLFLICDNILFDL
jgi:radial spoke head protein 9